MSPKRTSPLKFSAGGSQSPKQPKRQDATPMQPPKSDDNSRSTQNDSSPNSDTAINSSALSIITHGLQLKRTPFSLKNWIACLLTLDGRDKFTKVLQYSSRMLAWWFGGLAASSTKPISGADAGNAAGLSALLHNKAVLYKLLSVRFNLLYKSFVESRKAFRMGRMFIEYDKLRSMGWGEYLVGMMRDPVGDGATVRHVHGSNHEHLKKQYPTHSIPEDHDEDNSDHEGYQDAEGRESWNEDDEDEKKSEAVQRIVARPGRPHLPSRVSSNIGWGPGIASTDAQSDEAGEVKRNPPNRTVSELGTMYKSSRSSSLGWIKETKDHTIAKTVDVPPGWKLVGSTLKLIGLMGFWTFDNLAFLTGTGFLDPFSVSSGTNSASDSDPKKLRLQRKKRASEWGARFYFMGCLAGLYVNSRAIWEHSNGPLQKAQDELNRCAAQSKSSIYTEEQVTNAKQQFKKAKTKHFELYVALLKSICDCIVFSNNPGVDLHLKFRGKKNHEGLHCCCGLVSAGTVLFGNFPNV